MSIVQQRIHDEVIVFPCVYINISRHQISNLNNMVEKGRSVYLGNGAGRDTLIPEGMGPERPSVEIRGG